MKSVCDSETVKPSEKVDAVVLGGGVMGCSTLYHLTKLGISNSILIEKDQLTAGTTWHTAGWLINREVAKFAYDKRET